MTCGIPRGFAASIAENFRSSARPSFLHSHLRPPSPATARKATSPPEGEPPRLDGLSDRQVDLCSAQGLSSAITIDREGSHRAMVQPELLISVLFMIQGGTNLFVRNQ